MFIATSRFNGPSSGEAKCDSLDNISLLRSLLNPNEALGYKYFVPTGLRPFFASYFVITHNSNTLTEHYPKFPLLATPNRSGRLSNAAMTGY